jgi:beta-phosphoglucomutase-like phosphatase (HAD superfamily)
MTRVASDMDGVFVDSERYWFERGRQEIFPVCVAGDVDPEAVTGMNVEDRYDHLDCEFGTTVSKAPFADRYDRVANETYDERVALLEESEPLAEALRERGANVALVSPSAERRIDRVLDRFDLRATFDAVVSAKHVELGIPVPDVCERAATLVRRDPSPALATGDFIDALRRMLGYRSGTNESAAVADVDRMARGPDELREAVLEWVR